MVALEEATRRVERRLELSPNDSRALSLGSHAFFDTGRREEAIAMMEQSLELHPDEQSVWINAMCLTARVGERDRALELLDVVANRGWGKKDWILNDPDYDSLRDEPRFRELLDRLS